MNTTHFHTRCAYRVHYRNCPSFSHYRQVICHRSLAYSCWVGPVVPSLSILSLTIRWCVFQMPVIKRLRPGCGPVSGGTRVLIDFEYLNGRHPVVTYLLEEQCTGVIVV